MLKRIGTYAREDLERTLDTKVNLQLWVKVREDWINDSNLVKKIQITIIASINVLNLQKINKNWYAFNAT